MNSYLNLFFGESSIWFTSFFGAFGILFSPIIAVGFISFSCLMMLSSFAYLTKCFENSRKAFALLHIFFALAFSVELINKIFALVYSRYYTGFLVIRLGFFCYSSFFGIIAARNYEKTSPSNSDHGMVYNAVDLVAFHLMSFFFAISDAFKWNKVRAEARGGILNLSVNCRTKMKRQLLKGKYSC
jgi:hypothetical protein